MVSKNISLGRSNPQNFPPDKSRLRVGILSVQVTWDMVVLLEEIRRSTVEVGSWNPIIYRVLYIPGGWPWGFWTINSITERCFHDAWTQQKPESYPMIPLGRSLKDPVSKMTAVGCVTRNRILMYLGFLPVCPSDSDNYLQGREKEHHDAWCFTRLGRFERKIPWFYRQNVKHLLESFPLNLPNRKMWSPKNHPGPGKVTVALLLKSSPSFNCTARNRCKFSVSH